MPDETAVKITLVISDFAPDADQSVVDVALGYVRRWLRETALTPDSVTVELAEPHG